MKYLFTSDFRTNHTCMDCLSLVTHCSTCLRYTADYFLKHFILCIYKQRRASDPDPPPTSKEPQAARWSLAALLFFDSVPHNPLSNFGRLWGTLSNFANCIVTFSKKKLKKCKKLQILIFCRSIHCWEPYTAEYS